MKAVTRRLPNLKQLRAFEAAARQLSFKRAADELSVSQAAISHQIKALEEFYGCRLFDRLNRKVILTDAAKELASSLSDAFDLIEKASNKFRSDEMKGNVRISVTPFYANRMILPYLDEFLDTHPGLTVDFEYSYQISDFSASHLNAALRYSLSDRTDARMRLIHFDQVVPVASPSLIGKAELPMSPKEIAGYPLAAVLGQERYWEQWFEAARFTKTEGINWSMHEQRALALDYALAGNSVALADLPLIRNELENGSLIQLSPISTTLDRGIHLAEPPGPFSDARVSAFGDWLEDLVRRFTEVAGG